jgi:hypothetical protein
MCLHELVYFYSSEWCMIFFLAAAEPGSYYSCMGHFLRYFVEGYSMMHLELCCANNRPSNADSLLNQESSKLKWGLKRIGREREDCSVNSENWIKTSLWLAQRLCEGVLRRRSFVGPPLSQRSIPSSPHTPPTPCPTPQARSCVIQQLGTGGPVRDAGQRRPCTAGAAVPSWRTRPWERGIQTREEATPFFQSSGVSVH